MSPPPRARSGTSTPSKKPSPRSTHPTADPLPPQAPRPCRYRCHHHHERGLGLLRHQKSRRPAAHRRHPPAPHPVEHRAFQRISKVEHETHQQAGRTIAKITREWGWYNPRAAKLRTPFADESPGPIEDGYYWTQAFLDEDGIYRTWRQEAFILKGERRELLTYDADGTETGRRIETRRWYSCPVATRNVGPAAPHVLGGAGGDDDRSWFPFERTLTTVLRIEDFGLAQLDEIRIEYGPTGAAVRQVDETTTWYSQRTATTGVPRRQHPPGS